jgi:hypothetical protein
MADIVEFLGGVLDWLADLIVGQQPGASEPAGVRTDANGERRASPDESDGPGGDRSPSGSDPD